jgi:hypothetical protein
MGRGMGKCVKWGMRGEGGREWRRGGGLMRVVMDGDGKGGRDWMKGYGWNEMLKKGWENV